MGCTGDKNANDSKKFENIENIEIPRIPIDIINMFKNDYKFIIKYLDYKRDSTLALLKIYNAIMTYDDNFNLSFENKFENKKKYFESIYNYIKIFITKVINFYKNKYNYNIINEHIPEIIIEIFNTIYKAYKSKFFYWPNSPGVQKDYINIDIKNKIDRYNIRYYWHFQGVIFIQYTKFKTLIDNYSYKIEFNGNPKLQIVCLDIKKLEKFEKIEENIFKEYIDTITNKILEQSIKNIDLEFDI